MPPGKEAGVLTRDTTRDAEALQVRIWRSLSTTDLAGLIGRASRGIRTLALAGVRARHPDASADELAAHLASIILGTGLARQVYSASGPGLRSSADMTSPIDVALLVTTALESCGIRYTIGGSIASSLSGEPRASIDADILVDMRAEQVDRFVSLLGPEFYADNDALRRAIRNRSNTNLVHRPSGVKVDLYIADSRLDSYQLERRQRVQIASDPDRYLFVHSPEDILLQKLHWYRSGGEVSERQWRDVLSIVLVQGTRLDRVYLSRVAAEVGLTDLLQRAYVEAGRTE